MSKNTSNTIIALLTGAVIGAGIGILYAPDKGSKTRRKIKDGLDQSKDDFLEKYDEMVDLLKSKSSDVKASLEDSIEHFIENGSHKVDDVIDFLQEKLEALKKQNAKLHK